MSRALLLSWALLMVLPVAASRADDKPKPASEKPAAEQREEPDWSPVIAAGTKIAWDVPTVPGGSPQQAVDVYAPPNVRNAPVVLFVHGGEWAKRDKIEVAAKPRFFNSNGIVFVSVNYRLSGDAPHPAQADDVAAAVRWARDHIAEYGGSPRKLVLMGHSAGCHLVTLVGLDAKYLKKVGLSTGDLAGVVSWSGGAFDLVDKVEQGGMYAGYIRQCFGDDPKVWRDASPMQHVADGRPAPQFLLASAEGDKPASRAASEKMAGLINAAGGSAQYILIAGKDHRAANQDVGQKGDSCGQPLLSFVKVSTTHPAE